MSFEIKRKPTRQVRVGSVKIGGDAPISVQSMTNTQTQDVAATVAQIKRLEAAGCEIIRVAVPDETAAGAIKEIKKQIHIPLIADIHFDYKLAILSANAGADALRINPGNIGGRQKIQTVVDCAKDHGIAIRIGVNAGSLEKDLIQKHGGVTVDALVESALNQVDLMASFDFTNFKLAIKSSSVPQSVDAYRQLSARTDFPLHVGITEAGGLFSGIVKSSLGIGMLLSEGIGDTLRVSLTRDPVEEVRVGFEILKALGIRRRGPEIISCPTCGRCRIDLFSIAEAVETALLTHTAPIKVAIMGCVVNGPGEAREADVGIAGGRHQGVLFRKGRLVRKVPEKDMARVLIEEVKKITSDK
jgi:(E)-4-hydroxy-3-methylbut-2-enyl-diphosphate synthase